MPYKLMILPQSDLCIIAYSGRVSEHDLIAAQEFLRASTSYAPHFDELVAIGPDADYSEISYEIAYARAQAYVAEAAKTGRPKRLAFVCANRPEFAMAHMFRACMGASGPEHVEVECFLNLNLAVDWIDEVRPDRPLDREHIARLLNQMGHSWCRISTAAA